jgi:hypothetical protein
MLGNHDGLISSSAQVFEFAQRRVDAYEARPRFGGAQQCGASEQVCHRCSSLFRKASKHAHCHEDPRLWCNRCRYWPWACCRGSGSRMGYLAWNARNPLPPCIEVSCRPSRLLLRRAGLCGTREFWRRRWQDHEDCIRAIHGHNAVCHWRVPLPDDAHKACLEQIRRRPRGAFHRAIDDTV